MTLLFTFGKDRKADFDLMCHGGLFRCASKSKQENSLICLKKYI